MSGESESGRASGEARREIPHRPFTESSSARYDALLRYLRGLYVRGGSAGRGKPAEPGPEREKEREARGGR